MHTSHPDVQIVPNSGWDARITAFRYRRLVTNFAVVSERYVVLIDTMINAATAHAMVTAMQGALPGRQLLVINSHADWDHCWGNSLFAGDGVRYPAPIIAHRLCRERLLSDEARTVLYGKQRSEPELYEDVRLQPPTVTFDDSLVIDGGDLTFQLIHVPGHTSDLIAVWIPEIRTLFPADAVEDPLPFVDRAEDVPFIRASLERLLALHPQTVLLCHVPGSDSHQPDLIHGNIAYFNEIERRSLAALATGRVPSTLDDGSDVEAMVAFPFAEVPHIDALADDEERDFYHGGHRSALRTMVEHLRTNIGA